jgi:UDP-2-acetamido-2,6-beta-L-arabino-hexul-4-ose reductase
LRERRVAVTGADGFIARNVALLLAERGDTVIRITRSTTGEGLRAALAGADVVLHLAGVNRPKDSAEFDEGNTGFTTLLCDELRALDRPMPVVYASSSQAVQDNPYGRSKRAAELALERFARESGAPVAILRLWNVFGKFARPNYNSVVATFCHNIARGLPIVVSDPAAPVRLVHVDDVAAALLRLVDSGVAEVGLVDVGPVHGTTVGDLAATIRGFAESRRTLMPGAVGAGFLRALYSTYVSYLPTDGFSYALTRHEDPRGAFAEMLRTPDAGQFSFFTAHPGVTRGGHYHHTKTEKFLVVRGRARFGFRHVVTDERFALEVHGGESRVVETVPGWAHDVTNIGDEEMIVMLWANETFDPQRPDTIAAGVRT